MQCPDCKRLRHEGPCEPVYDELDELEMLALDADRSLERYLAELAKQKAQR